MFFSLWKGVGHELNKSVRCIIGLKLAWSCYCIQIIIREVMFLVEEKVIKTTEMYTEYVCTVYKGSVGTSETLTAPIATFLMYKISANQFLVATGYRTLGDRSVMPQKCGALVNGPLCRWGDIFSPIGKDTATRPTERSHHKNVQKVRQRPQFCSLPTPIVRSTE